MAATESGDETPAIRALGSLFKTRDYYLWDDAVVDTSVSCEGFADRYKDCCRNLDAKSQIGPITNEYPTSEDLELAQEREALGLPLAFSTAKEKRNLTTRRKRHGAQTYDELDASQCMAKEENDTCVKFQDVHDVLLQHAVNNSLSANNEDGEFHCPEIFISMTDGETLIQSATMRRKKKLRKRQSTLTMEGDVGDFPANVAKYWCQRYLLFSQFDDGIKMDEEGWFSVTPESIARHHASRCGNGTVVDCFAGVGGNSIQFAFKSNHVIAIDIDSQRIDYAQHNAAIYGVSDKIDFINADFFQIAHCLKGDSVFLSPPWGGPDYAKVQKYDMETMLKPHTGSFLFKIASKMAPKVVMFLPRNVDLNQLAELALSATPPWSLEVERNFLNGKLKAITAYFENTAK
ncbi:trimethylguanosine synthase-like isoform X3 [Dioscorea cayenensis subsp. rotundata]|uniref:Trimethylguanosine synthase n=1 Tax=Dioscorea cayennensis subsp. rotundata TaxID=55577 RepID=A0AB40BIF4_DIOCR|nr:trimethylguanosine synthase-like isoform X3 [Dioscorea cayenensis subsp. rotundata]